MMIQLSCLSVPTSCVVGGSHEAQDFVAAVAVLRMRWAVVLLGMVLAGSCRSSWRSSRQHDAQYMVHCGMIWGCMRAFVVPLGQRLGVCGPKPSPRNEGANSIEGANSKGGVDCGGACSCRGKGERVLAGLVWAGCAARA